MSDRPSGTLVRVRCGATGRAVGIDDIALFVGSQDNDLCFDQIDHDRFPQPDLPVPTDDELYAFRIGYRMGSKAVSVPAGSTP
jgi:hypothetical protein